MTRRSICSKVAAVACAAAALLAAALLAAAPSRADDRASVEHGRQAGRGLLILRDPRACGIALLHARCRADVDAFLGGRGDDAFAGIPKIGAHPATGLRAFVDAGDRTGYDPALAYLNTRSATAAMWTADPRDAALFDAGVTEVMFAAARGNGLAEMFTIGPVVDLRNHVGTIPADALGTSLEPLRAPRASGRPSPGPNAVAKEPITTETAFARELRGALMRTLPPAPFAAPPYADGPLGDAVLGIASATTAQLIDSPDWLAQDDTQLFLDAYVARVRALRPDAGPELERFRASLRPGADFAHDAVLRSATAAIVPLVGPGKERSAPLLLGMLSAQMVYNAAILRSPEASRYALRVLAGTPALDAALPGFAELRGSAANVAEADWAAQYRLGLRVVDALLKGSTV